MQFSEIETSEEQHGIPRVIWAGGCILILAFLSFSIFIASSFEGRYQQRKVALALEAQREATGNDDHKTLIFIHDNPAKELPVMEPVPEGLDLDSKTVVGVVAGDVAHAYVLRDTPDRTVLLLSTIVNDRPVVISHNYERDITRVLTDPNSTELIKIYVGGWEYERDLVLMLENEDRFDQESLKIPLQDFPFQKTSLAEWVKLHPNTLVNFDEEKTDKNYYESLPNKHKNTESP